MFGNKNAGITYVLALVLSGVPENLWTHKYRLPE